MSEFPVVEPQGGEPEWPPGTGTVARPVYETGGQSMATLFPVDDEQLLAIPELVPFGIAMFDVDQNFIYGNAMHREIIGCGIGEAGSMDAWLALGCPDVRHRARVIASWYEDVWTRQLTKTFSLKAHRGNLREVEFRPVILDDGGLLVTLIDKTDQKLGEDALRLTEAKFRTLFHHAGIGIAIIDVTGRFFDVNPAFCSLVNFTKYELSQMSLEECIDQEDFQRLERDQRLALSESSNRGSREELEMRFNRKGSLPLRAKVSVAPIRYGGENRRKEDRGGSDSRFTAFFVRDVSAENATRDDLRESQEQNLAILEAVPDLIFLLDRSGLVLDQFTPTADWSGPEITAACVGESITRLMPHFGSQAIDLIHQALETHEVQKCEFTIDGCEGEFLARIAPAGASQAVAVIEDITVSRAAREVMALQAAAFNHLRDAIIVTDLKGRIREWNPAAESIFGYRKDEVIGLGLSQLYAPHDQFRFNQALSQSLTSEGQWQQENAPFFRQDGSYGRCDVLFVPVSDEQCPRSLLGIHHVQD